MKDFKTALILGLSIGLALILGARIIPWSGVNWGKIETLPGSTITVTGEARAESLPQIAHFSATVSEFAADRDTVVNQVNSVMAQLIAMVKDFGIEDEDIQTQQLSVYEVNDGGQEILIYPPRPGRNGWQASNSIEITLKNIDQASAMADLLQSSGATGVSGPNFTMEDTDDLDAQLLEEAVDDARAKAEVIAKASDRRLGKVITVSESGASIPMYRGMESSVGAMDAAIPTPVEPGSQTVYKTVTVLFELR